MAASLRMLSAAVLLAAAVACTTSPEPQGGAAAAGAPGAAVAPQAPVGPAGGGPSAEASAPPAAGGQPAGAVSSVPAGATSIAGRTLATPGSAAIAAGAPEAAAPPAPPAPVVRELEIPAGTEISVRLDEPVASDTHAAGAKVAALLDTPLVVDGITVASAGSAVEGRVTAAQRSGRVKGRAELSLTFDAITPAGTTDRYAIHTGALARRAAGEGKKDAMKIGIPAAGGAILGGILGGKKGAVVGGAVGGGAGTAVVLSTRGEEVRLPKGRLITLELKDPVSVRVTVPPGK